MEHPIFNHVIALAQRLERHILVYDLEATTFRGRPNFGITEVSCFVVSPAGAGVTFGDLIDPERSIEPRVEVLTGITHEMVKGQQTWGAKYAALFTRLAAGECWVCGFNNSTFDDPAVLDMNRRYGQPTDEFMRTFDVRRLHLRLSGAKGSAGTLAVIAALYGVTPRGALHRAAADVALTLELLNAVIAKYGVEAVVQAVLTPKASPAKPAGAKAAAVGASPSPSPPPVAPRERPLHPLVQATAGKEFVTLPELATAMNKELRAVSFEVGKAIDERLIDPRVFANATAQDWLEQAFLALEPQVLTQGKLKPVLDGLSALNPAEPVDYVQLRIGMLRAGLSWSSLSPG